MARTQVSVLVFQKQHLWSIQFPVVFVSVWTFRRLQHCGAKQFIVESSLRDMKRTVWSPSEMGMCLFWVHFNGLVMAEIFLQITVCASYFGWHSRWNMSTLVVRDKIWGDIKNKQRVKMQKMELERTQVISGLWSRDQWKYKWGRKYRLCWSLSWSYSFIWSDIKTPEKCHVTSVTGRAQTRNCVPSVGETWQ